MAERPRRDAGLGSGRARAVSPLRAVTRAPPQIGAMIRAARLARGMTQPALARRIGVTRPVMMRIESGRRGCSLLELGAIADALEIDPVRLFERVLARLKSR